MKVTNRELQSLIYDLSQRLRRSHPTSDYQRGVHDTLVLLRDEARALVAQKPGLSKVPAPYVRVS